MPSHPLLYEIDTRCWLKELSQAAGVKVDLGNVPDEQFRLWQQLGFTHIWLMGVWTSGPRARKHSLTDPGLRRTYREVLPGWQERDVVGSPYAIADYHVARTLGGEAGLQVFRRKLREHGLKLILDFVPNHLGPDHPWLPEQPGRFVQSPVAAPGTFQQETCAGNRWFAYGKAQYCHPWIDTVQLDYRRPETRAAMIEVLRAIGQLCDGVRCDMAMLLLTEVFDTTWKEFPSLGPYPKNEFWQEAIETVKGNHADFLFLAEVYWEKEKSLQRLGFDYTYDKCFYDHLVAREHRRVQRHLLEAPAEFLSHSVHFLENHDETRIASKLSLAEHRAAALALLSLPSLRLLYDGQLTGARLRSCVHLGRRTREEPQPEVARLYAELLRILPDTSIGRGQSELLRPSPAWDGNPTAENFVIVQWQQHPPNFDLVVVNLAAHRSQCYVSLNIDHLAEHDWQMKDLLGEEIYTRPGRGLREHGLYLDLPPHGAQLFQFQPSS